MEKPCLNRRAALLAPLIAATLGQVATSVNGQDATSRVLVAYVTRSGNTRVIAGALSRQFNARLFEIRTAEPYPGDYEAHVTQARIERDEQATPKLAEHLQDLSPYDTVFLGSPVWGEAMPAPLRSFLSTHDFAGKIIAPFITHGGFGPGSLPETLAYLAPSAKILPPFLLECDQERRTLDRLSDWLDITRPQMSP